MIVKVEIVVEVVAEKSVDFGLGEHVFSWSGAYCVHNFCSDHDSGTAAFLKDEGGSDG